MSAMRLIEEWKRVKEDYPSIFENPAIVGALILLAILACPIFIIGGGVSWVAMKIATTLSLVNPWEGLKKEILAHTPWG